MVGSTQPVDHHEFNRRVTRVRTPALWNVTATPRCSPGAEISANTDSLIATLGGRAAAASHGMFPPLVLKMKDRPLSFVSLARRSRT